jgi:hypothetical protein
VEAEGLMEAKRPSLTGFHTGAGLGGGGGADDEEGGNDDDKDDADADDCVSGMGCGVWWYCASEPCGSAGLMERESRMPGMETVEDEEDDDGLEATEEEDVEADGWR